MLENTQRIVKDWELSLSPKKAKTIPVTYYRELTKSDMLHLHNVRVGLGLNIEILDLVWDNGTPYQKVVL